MPVKEFRYVALTDEDNTTLHKELIDVPEALFEHVKDAIDDTGHDLRTEGLIKNLLRNGAQRVDGHDGQAAITVLHFNDPSTLALYRAGAELDEHDAPLTVMEKHFKDGRPHFTVGYNRSGIPDHVSFDATNRKTLFMNNMDDGAAIAAMRAIVAAEARPPVISMKKEMALTA